MGTDIICTKISLFFVLVFIIMSLIFGITVNAQVSPSDGIPTLSQPTQVSGRYSNLDYGLDIVLPNGWSGMEIKLPGGTTMVTVIPDNMPSTKGTLTTMMTITVTPKNQSTTPPTEPANMPQDEKCSYSLATTKIINDVNFSETVSECTGTAFMKMKSDIAQTDKYYVNLSYIITPPSNYDSNVGIYDTTLGTIHLSNAIEAPSIPEFPIAVVSVITAFVMTFAIIVVKKHQIL